MSQAREKSSLPEHVTAPLLSLITARSMDEDYAHVAARRARESGADAPPARRSGSHWTTWAVVVVFGLLASVAIVQTEREAEVHELSRAALVEQVEAQQSQVDDLEAEVSALVRDNQDTASYNQVLLERLRSTRSEVTRLEVRTGYSRVRGEGVRITVDNAEGADSTSEIRDEDLATLVDALWEAGAEAVAINNQRINMLGGIRNTNRAVHVNGNPINAPYVVTAIGDSGTLQARLVQTSQGREWFALVNGLGFRYEAENVDDVQMSAAPLRDLRAASSEPVHSGRAGGRGVTP